MLMYKIRFYKGNLLQSTSNTKLRLQKCYSKLDSCVGELKFSSRFLSLRDGCQAEPREDIIGYQAKLRANNFSNIKVGITSCYEAKKPLMLG